MGDLDRIVHEPARLRILGILSGAEEADFSFLVSVLGLTKGNLSSHVDRLERAGYVEVIKTFDGKIPHTSYRLTAPGRAALDAYWRELEQIRPRALGASPLSGPPGNTP